MNMTLSELINEIVSEWAYRVNDGMPDPKNPTHITELGIVLSEMGLSNIKNDLIATLLIEAESKQFSNPILNKEIPYKNVKNEPKTGIVGNLLRLPKGHPGRDAAEKMLPPEGSQERDAMNKDLGSEKDGRSGDTSGQKPSGEEGGEQGGSPEDKMKQAQAMFDPKVDPAMAARLDKEKEIQAQLAADAEAEKDAEAPTDDKIDGDVDSSGNIKGTDIKAEPQLEKIPPKFRDEVNTKLEDLLGEVEAEEKRAEEVVLKDMGLGSKDELTDNNKDEFKDRMKRENKPPNLNLCKVTVPGTNLYCDDNKGLKREEMPQFKGKPVEGKPASGMEVDPKTGLVDIEDMYREHLKQKGITISEPIEVPSESLKATQDELVGAQVVSMTKALEKDPKNPFITAPIYVSKDGYIVDGHHRWAAIMGYNMKNADTPIPMKVMVIDDDINNVIPDAIKFADEQGIERMSGKTAGKDLDNKQEPSRPDTTPASDKMGEPKELEPVSDDVNSKAKKFKGEISGEEIQTIPLDGGAQIFGTKHKNTKMVDDILKQVKSTIPQEKWKDIVFVGEGGASNDAGELEFNDEMVYAADKFKEMGSGIDTFDGDDLDVHKPESKLYQKQKEKTGLSDSQVKAGNWASMIGQGEGTDTMNPSKFLDDEGKNFLQNAAQEAELPPIENWDTPSEKDKDTLYRLSFPQDNNDTETKVNDVQVAFNQIRDENLIEKTKELQSQGKIPITIAGEGHVDLVDKMMNKSEEKPEEIPTEKLPEPEKADETPGGVIYPIGGGYYSDSPDGPAQYVKTESIVSKFLLEGEETWVHLLFEKTVNKTTPSGKKVTVNVIEPRDQTKATKVANKKSGSKVNYDDRVEGDISAKVEQTYNTDSKFSEPGMKHEDRVRRLKNMKSKEINSTKIEDVYKAMGINKGATKFPAKYMSVLTNALNFAKGPFTITDLTDAAGAGTLDSTLGELITLMGATIQNENQRNAFFNWLREQIKAGGNESALTVAWVNSAQDSCVAFHRKIQKDCPGGHEVKTNFWDIASEAQAAGVKNYKRDKGKSTDINTMVDCISKDGSRTQKWLQPSLKKSKKVNAFNSTTGRVFATTVLRWGTSEEKAKYSALGNELDSYDGLDDNAPAGENTITDKKGNVRPMTIKERKTQLNKEMRDIEAIYEDKIPKEANPREAVIRQAKLHQEYFNNDKAVKERDDFLYAWRDMKPNDRKKLALEISKQMGQKGDKYAKELENTLNKLSEYDTSTPENLEAALEELGFTKAKDKQKLMVAIMNGIINTSDGKPIASQYKNKLVSNSHGHSKAVLEFLINDNENKKALLENISTAFPLKDLMEGKEWAILGEKGGGINLDKDTITKCLGADKFEDVVEKLVIVHYKGEPTLAYAADNGTRTVPIGQINCRPDGIAYGSTWKLELSIHEGFADCCKEHDK